MVKLGNTEAPTNVMKLKTLIYNGLKDQVLRRYTVPDKVFLGETDEDRERWIESCIEEFVVDNWEKYDDDNSGDLDDIESYNLLSDLDPKQTIDLVGYKFIFKKMDTNEDGSLDQDEF